MTKNIIIIALITALLFSVRIGSGESIDFQEAAHDEIRISTSVISADLITTEYNNQNSPSTFYTWGAREDNSAGGGSIFVPTAAIL